ncbi:CBS domain-containing protein [Plantibacter flavus]|uniref:CBS domain-containing protein n=1 Tax=Plantibacter flavus TaxID=150123 RepID=UPI003F1866B7
MTTAADLMTDDPAAITPADTLVETAEFMRDLDSGVLPVIDDDGYLIGVITERDIVVHAIAKGFDPGTTLVDVLGFQVVYTVSRETDLDSIRSLMQRRRVRELPVVDDGGFLVGMISLRDVAAHTADALTRMLTTVLSE